MRSSLEPRRSRRKWCRFPYQQDTTLSAIVTAHHATRAERYELKNDARNHNGSEESGAEASGSPTRSRRTTQAKLNVALDAAWAGRFSVLVVWAVDRLTRQMGVPRMPCA